MVGRMTPCRRSCSRSSRRTPCAARRFAENLSGRVPSWEVSAELKDWKEAESQLHHAYACMSLQGQEPNEYLSRPDDHGARETTIRKVVHASFCARLNGKAR